MKLEYKPRLTLEAIPPFSKEILAQLEPYCLDQYRFFDIRLAFEEALVNAVKHGNKDGPDKHVFISVEITDEAITIDIKDQGKGFDYEAVAVPTEQENLEKPSGRGVFLMKSLMDSVTYLDNGSRVRMVKRLK